MQWIIDIMTEWAEAQGYLTTGFVDRGDPAAADFTKNDFTRDGNWHDLDLSTIVPADAKCVALSLVLRNALSNKYTHFRKAGNANEKNMFSSRTQVASVTIEFDGTCPISSDRKIAYKASANNWTDISLTVKGWWL